MSPPPTPTRSYLLFHAGIFSACIGVAAAAFHPASSPHVAPRSAFLVRHGRLPNVLSAPARTHNQQRRRPKNTLSRSHPANVVGTCTSAYSAAPSNELSAKEIMKEIVEVDETESSSEGTVLDNGDTMFKAIRVHAGDQTLCWGTLIEPSCCSSSGEDGMQNRSTKLTRHDGDSRREAWISSSAAAAAVADGSVSEQAITNGIARAIDSLLLHHLILERGDYKRRSSELAVRLDSRNDVHDENRAALLLLLHAAASARGFSAPDDQDHVTELSLDYGRAIRAYTEVAIEERGTDSGQSALAILGLLSSRRVPYEFSDDDPTTTATPEGKKRTVVAPQKKLLPKEVTDGVLAIMAEIEDRGWLSTNLDSVDKLPSLHLNLLSGGKQIFLPEDVVEDEGKDELQLVGAEGNTKSDFKRKVGDLTALVEPHLYGTLLPKVRELMNSTTVELSDVFIRRYGENVQQQSEQHRTAASNTRFGISAHFDVTSSVTSVIALDDVASEGKSGLYTVVADDSKSSGWTDPEMLGAGASNHAALRRYFPLSSGDAVVHTWDVLHGVEIDPSQSRTSLIVWFEDHGGAQEGDGGPSNSPSWLANPDDEDDIGLFVLASATEGSVRADHGDDGEMQQKERGPSSSMTHEEPHESESRMRKASSGRQHPYDLYIKSASMGNAFALTRLGTLCEEGGLTSAQLSRAKSLLQRLRPSPFVLDGIDEGEGKLNSKESVALGLWYEGAVRGNSLAQAVLADECMGQSMKKLNDGDITASQDLRLVAAVLFALAAQQGHGEAGQSLLRVLDVECSLHESEEDLPLSPVLLTAQASMPSL